MSVSKDSIGHRVKVMRVDARLSRKELAEKSGVSINTIEKCESGISMPTLETTFKLAAALGCTPNDICDFPVNA